MELRDALKEQYHGGLAMLAECVEKCPDDLWVSPSPRSDEGDRVIFRSFWRIAFHAAYFTHLYVGQNEAAFQRPDGFRADCEGMWSSPWDIEPYELPEEVDPYSRQQMLDYIRFVDSLIDSTVDGLDLET